MESRRCDDDPAATGSSVRAADWSRSSPTERGPRCQLESLISGDAVSPPATLASAASKTSWAHRASRPTPGKDIDVTAFLLRAPMAGPDADRHRAAHDRAGPDDREHRPA